MAHHLPIVTTNEGGIPDIVKDGENGLISQIRNPQSLADNICKLLDDADLRRKMGENGYKRLHKYYTLEVFEQCMVQCLKKSINLL